MGPAPLQCEPLQCTLGTENTVPTRACTGQWPCLHAARHGGGNSGPGPLGSASLRLAGAVGAVPPVARLELRVHCAQSVANRGLCCGRWAGDSARCAAHVAPGPQPHGRGCRRVVRRALCAPCGAPGRRDGGPRRRSQVRAPRAPSRLHRVPRVHPSHAWPRVSVLLLRPNVCVCPAGWARPRVAHRITTAAAGPPPRGTPPRSRCRMARRRAVPWAAAGVRARAASRSCPPRVRRVWLSRPVPRAPLTRVAAGRGELQRAVAPAPPHAARNARKSARRGTRPAAGRLAATAAAAKVANVCADGRAPFAPVQAAVAASASDAGVCGSTAAPAAPAAASAAEAPGGDEEGEEEPVDPRIAAGLVVVRRLDRKLEAVARRERRVKKGRCQDPSTSPPAGASSFFATQPPEPSKPARHRDGTRGTRKAARASGDRGCPSKVGDKTGHRGTAIPTGDFVTRNIEVRASSPCCGRRVRCSSHCCHSLWATRPREPLS